MSLHSKNYDYGSELPSGISICNAVKYQVSVALKLPGLEVFEKELENRYEKVVSESFNTALDHLLVHKSYKNLIVKGQNAVYTSYFPGNSHLDKIYVDSLRSRSEKVLSLEKKTHDIDVVYTTYLAVSILTDLLKQGKCSCDIYVGMYPFAIVESYGDHKARSMFLSKEVVTSMYKEGKLDKTVYDSLENPQHVTDIVRKVYFRSYSNALLNIKKDSIFSAFSEKVCREAYPDLDVVSILRKQVADMTYQERTKMVDRVYKLYELGIVSSNVDISIPSIEDVKSIEEKIIPYSPLEESSNKVVINFVDTKLNYSTLIKELYIDGLYFPTITHYVYYNLTGKKYSHIYTDGKFISLPDISSMYIIVGDVSNYFHRAIFCNEVYGIGDKITSDLISMSEEGNIIPVGNISKLEADVYDLCLSCSQLLKRNVDLVKLKKVLPVAINWVEYRMENMYHIYNLLQLQKHKLNSLQLLSLQKILSGSCVVSQKGDDIFSVTKKYLYTNMRDILLKDSRMTPNDVVEYARRVIVPNTRTNLPREISMGVSAVKYIYENLSVILRDSSDVDVIKYCVKLLSDQDKYDAEYDDYTKLISKELSVSEGAAALVNGFLRNNANSDITHRRLLFYSAM